MPKEKTAKKTGKLFGVINLIDLLFVLAIIAAAAFAVIYFTTGGFKRGEPVIVYYTVEFAGETKGLHNSITVGENVKDSVKTYYLGVVDSVEVIESRQYYLSKERREFIPYILPDQEVILLTIKADGLETESTIYAGEIDVRIGKELNVEGKGYAFGGYIIDVRTEPRGDK